MLWTRFSWLKIGSRVNGPSGSIQAIYFLTSSAIISFQDTSIVYFMNLVIIVILVI
jgi:hypothetical protein